MTEVNPPGFLQNAGSIHTAEILRHPFNVLVGGRQSSGLQHRSRAGVHPQISGLYAVAQNGTPNMSVLIASGQALVAGSEGGLQGLYSCVNDASVNKSITAADPSLPRIDLVVLRVRDTFYSGVTNSFAIEVVTGVANSSPAVPTLPANSMALAQVAVAAGVTSIVNANITDLRPWLTAVGGITPVRTATERDALNNPIDGYAAWRQDVNRLEVWDGARYVTIGGSIHASWKTTPALLNVTTEVDVLSNSWTPPLIGCYRLEAKVPYDLSAGSPSDTKARLLVGATEIDVDVRPGPLGVFVGYLKMSGTIDINSLSAQTVKTTVQKTSGSGTINCRLTEARTEIFFAGNAGVRA